MLFLSSLALSPGADAGFRTHRHAVQTAVLPLLLPASATPPALYSPFNPPRDVCVSAPTGSGKTLSYVVPIVEVRQASSAHSSPGRLAIDQR